MCWFFGGSEILKWRCGEMSLFSVLVEAKLMVGNI